MKKIIVDILLFILMLIEYSRTQIPAEIHEITGICLIILVIIHLILNRKYLKAIPKGKYDFKRSLMLIVNLSFFVVFFLTVIFGALSSQYTLTIMNIGNMTTIYLHKILGYLSLILMAIHLGINLTKPLNKLEEKLGNKIYILYIILIILGIYSAIQLDFWNHLIGKSGFSIVTNTLMINTLEYLSLILMITIIVNLIWRRL